MSTSVPFTYVGCFYEIKVLTASISLSLYVIDARSGKVFHNENASQGNMDELLGLCSGRFSKQDGKNIIFWSIFEICAITGILHQCRSLP